VTQLAGSVRHILPNIVPPIIVQGTLAIAAGQPVVSGLGQQPPAPWATVCVTHSIRAGDEAHSAWCVTLSR
jgi:ABC-type dipeptide/oligopeptide/nickel transport system permease subunit